MKRLLAGLAVLLVLPATAAARLPDGPINDPHIHSSSLGAAPTAGPRQDLRNPDQRVVPGLAAHLQTLGTDAAATDQQAPQSRPGTVRIVSQAPLGGGFDWGAAAIGAAGMVGIFALMLSTVGTIRRRHTRQPSVATS